MESTETLYEELRPRAFAVAYRMLGSVSEAEDIVQEGFLRLHRTLEDGERIESPGAYLSTIVTRLAIDHMRSARARREQYYGEWLPEPIVDRPQEDPAQHAEVADSLSLAFLVLLESLSPEQRAAFLLREVFDYPYDQIADVVQTSEDNARQLVSRARRHVDEGRPRFDASREERDELAKRFFAAAEEGNVKELEELLAHDVVLHGDGGGKAPAVARALHGRTRAVRTLGAWSRAAARFEVRFSTTEVNGQPGAMILDSDDRILGVVALDIAEGQIQAIRSVVNPDKLGHLGQVGSVRELLRSGGNRPG